MRIPGMLPCLAGLVLGWTVRAGAQGPSSGVQFESLTVPVLECSLPECNGLQSARRQSRLGRSVLVGAVIGASVGLLAGYLVYSFCGGDDNWDDGSCAGKAFLAFGVDVAIGAAIGLLVGSTEPSRGPVPTD